MTLSLFRIIEPASGNIVIDGLDICKMGLDDVRKKLTVIAQVGIRHLDLFLPSVFRLLYRRYILIFTDLVMSALSRLVIVLPGKKRIF